MTKALPKAWHWRDVERLAFRPLAGGELITSESLRDQAPSVRMQRAALGSRLAQGPAPADPDARMAAPALVRMKGVFATNESYLKRYIGRNDDGYLQIRYARGKLDLGEGQVTAPVDTPAGVPMSLEHLIGGFWGLPALGRVLTMETNGTRLVGEYEVSPSELAMWYAGGVDDMRAGLHTGLSIGFEGVDQPKLERKDGSRWDPDLLTWGRINVIELAVTDLPALSGAGMLGVVEGDGEGGQKDEE